MKPWGHHTLTVVAAALAMKGRARVPAAVRPMDPRSTERLLSLLIAILLASPRAGNRVAIRVVVFRKNVRRRVPPFQTSETLIRASTRLRLSYSKLRLLQCSHAEMSPC